MKHDPGLDEDYDYFQIDPYDLQKEWLTQVKVYRHHARQLADAKEQLERAEATKKVVEAELDKDIRLHPSKYNIDGKITEKVVESITILQKPYQQALENVIKAKHSVNIHQVDVETLRQKKDALEAAVQMLLSSFWAEPRVKGKMDEAELQNIRRQGQYRRGER